MNYKAIFSICLFLVSSVSCMKEIDLEHLRTNPKLVLNSVVVAGQPVIVSLSRTWFYTEDHPNVTIENADIKLYVNGQLKEQMKYIPPVAEEDEYGNRYNNQGYYFALYQPQTGDQIKITADAEGFKQAEGNLVLPEAVPVLKFDVFTKKVEIGEAYYYVDEELHVTLKDDPGKQDYYLLNFEFGKPVVEYDSITLNWEYTGEYYWTSSYSVDYATDPIFNNDITALEKIMGFDWLSGYYGRVFSDDLINGKEYTIKLKTYGGSYFGHDPEEEDYLPNLCRVNLYTISESYYRYMKSLLEIIDGNMSRDLAEIGIAEPVRIYSNIQGGTGILGGSNLYSETTEIVLKEE